MTMTMQTTKAAYDHHKSTIRKARTMGLKLIGQGPNSVTFEGEYRDCAMLALEAKQGNSVFYWEADEYGDVYENLPWAHQAFTWGGTIFPVGNGLFHVTVRE